VDQEARKLQRQEDWMQLLAPLKLVVVTPVKLVLGTLKSVGIEPGRSLENARNAIRDGLPLDELLVIAAGICDRVNGSDEVVPGGEGVGPGDVVSTRRKLPDILD
jgi:hypothetical protein